MERFGFKATGSVTSHIKPLVKKGYIRVNRKKARGIEILREFACLRFAGRVDCSR